MEDSKEENKYYAPSIDELRLLFEFEEFYKGEWHKRMFWQNDLEPWEDMFEHLTTNARVKYLDEEDIESLGFRKVQFHGDPESPSYRFEKDHVHIYYTFEGIHKCNTRITFDKGDNIFIGKIKNKSELKILLKQLGIE